jgi:hypothetical protein
MRSLDEYKSKNSTSSVKFDSGKLRYTISKNKDTIYSRIDTVYTYKEVPIKVETQKTVYRMSKIQQFFYYVGLIAILSIIVFLSTKINYKQLINFIIKLFKI